MNASRVPGTFIKGHQVIPDRLADLIRAEYAKPGGTVNHLLAAARDAGWTCTALGAALGFSYEAIRLRANAGDVALCPVPILSIPSAPRWPTPVPPAPRLDVPDAIAADLRRMHVIAREVNGGTEVDDPARRVSLDLSKRLAELTERGYTAAVLSEALGVSPATISFRLARHGYRPQFPSQVKSNAYLGRKTGDLTVETCRRGHPFSGDNLLIHGRQRPQRVCRTCLEARRKRPASEAVR